MQSMCNTGAAFGGAAAIPATLDGAAGTVGPASAEAPAKEPTKVEPYQLLNFLECEMVTWKAWGDNIVNQDIRSSVAVKNLAIALWGSSVLQRTVAEMASNVSLNKDSRLPLTPKKATFLTECLMMKLRGQKHHADVIAVMSRTAKVNHILGEKMNDRRKQEK
ncbi:uncharacterized protein LOC120841368 [Ixodes scapularis]|uniref:uncharacterized protein LOC120841368 n=1 Tax=Ixodes scapularis TaxID=6945 RepID=UPI001C391B1D|nr:uncharacterized protein LOC120841368 [Ixodes scapularis]